MLFHLLAVSGLASRIRAAGSINTAVVIQLDTHTHAMSPLLSENLGQKQSSTPPIKKLIQKEIKNTEVVPPFELQLSPLSSFV